MAVCALPSRFHPVYVVNVFGADDFHQLVVLEPAVPGGRRSVFALLAAYVAGGDAARSCDKSPQFGLEVARGKMLPLLVVWVELVANGTGRGLCAITSTRGGDLPVSRLLSDTLSGFCEVFVAARFDIIGEVLFQGLTLSCHSAKLLHDLIDDFHVIDNIVHLKGG